MKYKHLFGPLASRRLGRSLGVDLIPYKYCPLNCVYCEVQSTTHLTLLRQEFFPPQEIISELDAALAQQTHLDIITFSGAGEPTLYSGIGKIISHIKSSYPQYPLALITNGVLLGDDQLQEEILSCDIVLPSLDAVSQDVFAQINRPLEGLLASELIGGLISFRQRFKGKIWLEVFIIPGVNDHQSELTLLSDAIREIMPDRVQLNSLDRPGTEEWIGIPEPQHMAEIRDFFAKSLAMPVEIISRIQPYEEKADPEVQTSIVKLLKYRDMSAEELSLSSGIHINEISKALRLLHQRSEICSSSTDQGVYYRWKY